MSDMVLTRDQRHWLTLVSRMPRECDVDASIAYEVTVRGLSSSVEVPGNDRRRIHTITPAGREWLAAHTRKA